MRTHSCPSCNAPCPQPSSGSDYCKCDYCEAEFKWKEDPVAAPTLQENTGGSRGAADLMAKANALKSMAKEKEHAANDLNRKRAKILMDAESAKDGEKNGADDFGGYWVLCGLAAWAFIGLFDWDWLGFVLILAGIGCMIEWNRRDDAGKEQANKLIRAASKLRNEANQLEKEADDLLEESKNLTEEALNS